MIKLNSVLLLTLLLTSFTLDNEPFEGKIVFNYSFTDLKGNDITDKWAVYFGRQQFYFINKKNYKSYDENNTIGQLYNSATNSYFFFTKDKVAKRIDGSIHTSKKHQVTKLEEKERVSGYECSIIEIETDENTTLYYYTPEIKTNTATFSRHNYGEWNQYLEATGGALALKFVRINHKRQFIWTSEATEVTRQDLADSEFAFPSGYKLNK